MPLTSGNAFPRFPFQTVTHFNYRICVIAAEIFSSAGELGTPRALSPSHDRTQMSPTRKTRGLSHERRKATPESLEHFFRRAHERQERVDADESDRKTRSFGNQEAGPHFHRNPPHMPVGPQRLSVELLVFQKK
jgi:hypothetical protein